MKLVSFQVLTPVGTFTRIGALQAGSIVDLNMAYARLLAGQGEPRPRRLADAHVPATMLEFLEGGPSAMAAARRALAFVTEGNASLTGPADETIVYDATDVHLTAPLPNPASAPLKLPASLAVSVALCRLCRCARLTCRITPKRRAALNIAATMAFPAAIRAPAARTNFLLNSRDLGGASARLGVTSAIASRMARQRSFFVDDLF